MIQQNCSTQNDIDRLILNVSSLFLYFGNSYSLILADNIVIYLIYLSFVIIYGNILKYIADTAKIFNDNCA